MRKRALFTSKQNTNSQKSEGLFASTMQRPEAIYCPLLQEKKGKTRILEN
jgi:hypothetical protein